MHFTHKKLNLNNNVRLKLRKRISPKEPKAKRNQIERKEKRTRQAKESLTGHKVTGSGDGSCGASSCRRKKPESGGRSVVL